MHKSKLLAYLKVFDKLEIAQLTHFIQSPYFFSGKLPANAIRLFDYLLPFYPLFEGGGLEKETIYSQFYPEQAYDKKRIELMMSHLFKVIERFIIIHFNDSKQIDQQLVLTDFLRKKGLTHYAEMSIRKMKKLQEKEKRWGSNYFHHQFRIAQEVMEMKSIRNLRDSDLNLPEVHQHLDAYYLVNKLDLTCHLLAQNKYHRPVELGDSINILLQLMPLFEQGAFDDIPLLKMYYEVFQWLHTDRPPSALFIESLRENSTFIPLDQLKAIHALYRNYCIRRYNENEEAYLPALFDIYRLSLEEGLLFVEEGLLQSTLQNIVSLGLKMKHYDWVYQFMETYHDKIIDTDRPEEIYANNLARYYFELKEFSRALNCLAQDYDDTYYKIAAKLIEIKIHYEQKNDLLEYKMQAFKVYLHRISNSLLPEVHKKGFKNFIDLLKQICHPSTLNKPVRIAKLRLKLKERKVIAEREWLQEKLQEIEV